jgi:small-conductance mechanosensitive channel
MVFLLHFNREHKFAILAPDFQRRFFLVISGLLYATITLMLFREAFMLAHYYRSELPTILLAINFIIFQISLILLIGKEQILNLIPTTNDFWLWVRIQVDRYYYVILLGVIAIIIMSNPYVGFGTLVLYILFALIYTGLLILGLFWLHGVFKKIASKVFFSTEDDIVRERFTSAKTWFGLIIIASFLTITFVGVFIGARIWGWPITLNDVYYFMHKPFIGEGTRYPITILALGKIILFIFGGLFVTYALNRLVLDKIFDLLLVEPGVQHTVATITQYLIVMIAVFLGFHSVGLGEQVGYVLAALTFSLGWVLKEPLSDFIAYFIILVQRPLKIGDYVRIDQETMGVVRHITARNVILRRLNSTTIIVPNAYVISRSIINWNYTRNFIAFDDIVLRIDFRENPSFVKELLLQAVEMHPNVLKNPRPVIRLEDFAENGYLFIVRGYLSSVYTLEQWDIASDVRLNIVKKLRENKIKIAVPVRIRLEEQVVLTAEESPKKDKH